MAKRTTTQVHEDGGHAGSPRRTCHLCVRETLAKAEADATRVEHEVTASRRDRFYGLTRPTPAKMAMMDLAYVTPGGVRALGRGLAHTGH